MNEIIIEVSNASKKIKNKVLLDSISLKIQKGNICGVIGRNGSGKTVLFKCLCGLMSLSSGEIKIKNKIIGKDVNIPENVGVIIETPGFLPNYSGYNNLKLLASINKKIDKETIYDSIRKVGLDPKSKKHVRKYSLGMRQRLGIAQAIMEEPEILILDEPMNGLDNQGVEDMRKMLLELKEQGKTILLASHSKEDIEILCDNIIEMDHGKIINYKECNKNG